MTGKNRENYNENYLRYVDSFAPPTKHFKNCTRAFLVGGFISPAEQRLLKEVKAAVGNLKVIVMDARPLKDFKPKAIVGENYVAGRVLRLSVWESPLVSNEQRRRFLKNNALAHLIAEGAEHAARE